MIIIRAPRLGRVILCLAVSILAARAGADESRLVSIKPEIHARDMEVFIRVAGPFRHSFAELAGPPRLVVDLSPVKVDLESGAVRVGAFGVSSIQVLQSAPDTARVVFELASRTPFYLVNPSPDGLRVVFLSGSPGKGTEVGEILPAAPVPAPARAPQPPPASREIPPGRQPSTFLGVGLTNTTLADERFRRVFGYRTRSGPVIEVSQVFLARGPWALAAAAEFRQLCFEGQSTVTAQSTQVSITPLDFGLRLIRRSGNVWPFIGAGTVFSPYREESPLQNTEGTAWGLSFHAGLIWGPPSFRPLKAVAFLRWSRAVARENGLRVDLGGLEVGGGLSLCLNFF